MMHRCGVIVTPSVRCFVCVCRAWQLRNRLPACYDSFDHKLSGALKTDCTRYAEFEVCRLCYDIYNEYQQLEAAANQLAEGLGVAPGEYPSAISGTAVTTLLAHTARSSSCDGWAAQANLTLVKRSFSTVPSRPLVAVVMGGNVRPLVGCSLLVLADSFPTAEQRVLVGIVCGVGDGVT